MYTSFQNKIEMSSPNVVQCELFDIVIELTVTYCFVETLEFTSAKNGHR